MTVALFATFVGLTLFDAAAERQTVPWSPKPEPTAQPTVGPGGDGGTKGRHVSVTPSVDCTETSCDREVEILNDGTEPVEVFTPEVTDDPTGSFWLGEDCAGQRLDPAESCSYLVEYTPKTDEAVGATLLVHHNAGPDPSAVRLTGSGLPEPVSGNVWFSQPPACQRAEDGSLIVTGMVAADAGAGAVAVAVLAGDGSLLFRGPFTVDQPGALFVPDTEAGSDVEVRIDPDGTIERDDPGDNSTAVRCP